MTGFRALARVARRWETPLLLGRAGAGTVMLVAPAPVADLWLASRSRAARRIVRAVGARDLLVCAGIVLARPHRRERWRQIGGASDLVDAIVAIERAIRRRRPATALVAVPAFGNALLTASTARRRPAGR